MAQDILYLLSPTYREHSNPEALQKRAHIASLLPAGGKISRKKSEGTRRILATLSAEGHEGVTRDNILDYSVTLSRVYTYLQDENFRREMDAAIENNDTQKFTARNQGLLYFIRDNPEVKTLEDAQEKIKNLAALPPESEARTEMEEEPVALRAEELPANPPPPISAGLRPFGILAGAIQDIAEAEEHIHRTVEEIQETITDLQKRLEATEKQNRSLKQDIGNLKQRLAEIDDLLIADHAQLATVQDC